MNAIQPQPLLLEPAADWHPGAAAIPVTFAGTVGLFTPATGPTAGSSAVLFLSPWGLEEFCTRKLWRILAEEFSAKGIASLRFDYPGTGDALDLPDPENAMQAWQDAIRLAAATLSSLSGRSRVILVSQGVGCRLAADLADRLPDLAGIAFLAPVLSARAYFRELSLWSRIIDEGLSLTDAQRQPASISISGLKMPDDVAAHLRKRDLGQIAKAPASRCLVMPRSGSDRDNEFAARLTSLGATVDVEAYDGYDELMVNPFLQKMPALMIPKLVRWIEAVDRSVPEAGGAARVGHPVAESLQGDGFFESPVRLGAKAHLSGMLCQPSGTRRGATAILLTTAYDRHAGWGRSTVNMARDLARSGIASLRFDGANVGDSPPVAGRQDQILYDEQQGEDVTAAFDFLEQRDLLPAILAGRCSGAYLAFRSSLTDARSRGAVVVNPYVFAWNPEHSVTDTLRLTPRSLEAYGQKIVRLETLRRLFRREIDLKSALPNLVLALAKRLAAPIRRALSVRSAEQIAIRQAFERLNADQKQLELLYSEHDVGREHLDLHFGADGAGLSAFPNVTLTFVRDADHNFTPPAARAIFRNRIAALALRVRPGD